MWTSFSPLFLRVISLLAAAMAVTACSPQPTAVLVEAGEDLQPLLSSYIENTDWEGLSLTDETLPPGDWIRVQVLDDLDCSECFSIEGEDLNWTVRGDRPLGIQYGLTELLEQTGIRFFHPFRTHIPDVLATPTPDAPGQIHAPDIERRGLHLHTLHPIEGMFDFWTDSSDSLGRAEQVIDWVIKNQGNHLQWVALDDIEDPGTTRERWRAHTAAVLDVAHARGITVGLGVQLFGSGNLQQAFDLLDEVGDAAAQRAAMEERFGILTDGLDFDLINLSFGEFFGEDPTTFIESLNLAWDVLRELQPETEMTTVIHVGEDLRIEFEGEEILYYFLAAEAHPDIVPWVHTVMYFNLFEEALGAYGHAEFDEHRMFLLESLNAEEPVGYFPETAYWVSFDISVPQHLPLYLRARWLDLHEISAQTGRLPRDHVLFSSGWEWGYWLHDRSALRMSYSIPANYSDLIIDAYRPVGQDGAEFGQELGQLAETQFEFHLARGLGPYLAGRDSGMEFGDQTGIIAQPPRVSLSDFAQLESDQRDPLYQAIVLEGTDELVVALDAHLRAMNELDVPRENTFVAEALEGVELGSMRASFVSSLYRAVDQAAEGLDALPHISAAESIMEEARLLVGQRHADLHDPLSPRLLESASLPTLYQYGYLQMADTLCFWERELGQANQAIYGTEGAIPGCLF